MLDNGASYRRKNQLLFRLIIVYLPLSLLTPLVMYQLRDNNRLIVMDGRNSYHITEYADHEKLANLYEYTARLAVDAFLMRNPNGLDRPELFEAMYVDTAKHTALDQIKGESGAFERFEIHQKAEILKVQVIEADSKRSFVRISGQLIRSYVKDAVPGTYAVQFEAAMRLSTNFDLGRNALYPFIVTEITYNQTRKEPIL